MLRALPRVALQLWIVLFIVFFGAEVIHLEPGLRVITQVLYGLPLVVWAALRLRGPADRLDWAVLGLLALYALICLASRDVTESLGTLGLATAYGAWFGLMRRADEPLRSAVVLAVATGLAVTLAFNAYLAIVEKVEWYAAVRAAPLEGVVTFPWESVNTLPVLVMLAVPFLLKLPPGPARTSLAIAVVASSLIVIPISQGRAGYLGIAVAVVTYLALHPAIRRLAAQRRIISAAALAAGAVLVLVVIGPRFTEALATSGRLLIWEQGWSMIRTNPFLGSGPGVYAWVRAEFPPAGADLLALRLLHDVPLLTLVEGGIVLLAGFSVAFGTWLMTALAARSRWTTPDRAAAAALAGFAAASLLDDFSFLPSVIAMVLALAAFLAPASETAGRVRWLLPAVVAAAALASVPSIAAVDAARTAAQDGRTAMVAGAYGDAVAAFQRATAAHPQSGLYWMGLGMAAAYAGDTSQAVDAYERSTQTAPGDPRGYAALAAIGPPENEIAQLRAAAERTFDDPQDAARLGVALARTHDIAGAAEAWGAAVALRAEILRLLPYDATGISIGDVADIAIRRVREDPRPAPHENEAAVWDIGLAMDALPADAGVAWRAVDAARRGNLDTARRLAEEAVATAPFEARGHQATAAVAAFACDPDAERAALELERHGIGAYLEPDPDPRVLREFVYREASLGPTQPPGARLDLRVERWPWSLVDRPECET